MLSRNEGPGGGEGASNASRKGDERRAAPLARPLIGLLQTLQNPIIEQLDCNVRQDMQKYSASIFQYLMKFLEMFSISNVVALSEGREEKRESSL